MSQESDGQCFSVYVERQALHYINDVRIERSLQNFAYAFSCSLLPDEVDFRAGDKLEVFWREEELGQRKDPIFCGYIDRVEFAISGGPAARYGAGIHARSYALDLIDSVDSKKGLEGDLSTVFRTVCQWYSVPFTNSIGDNLGQVSFACEKQSPFQVLNDLARARGAMLVTNGWGALELMRPKSDILNSKQVLSLANIVELNYSEDQSQCYRKYSGLIRGVEYLETDTRIRKQRVLELASDDKDLGLLRSKLKNEKARRYGMSQRLKFTVAGWKAPDYKTHWYENSNIVAEIPELGIKKRSFFLYAVTLRLSKFSGYRAELWCCNKEAFALSANKVEKPSRAASRQQESQESQESIVALQEIKKARKQKLDGGGKVRGL